MRSRLRKLHQSFFNTEAIEKKRENKSGLFFLPFFLSALCVYSLDQLLAAGFSVFD